MTRASSACDKASCASMAASSCARARAAHASSWLVSKSENSSPPARLANLSSTDPKPRCTISWLNIFLLLSLCSPTGRVSERCSEGCRPDTRIWPYTSCCLGASVLRWHLFLRKDGRSAHNPLAYRHHRPVEGAHDDVAREEPNDPDRLVPHVAP